MKLKTSVAAFLFALSAGAVWAGDTSESKTDLGGPGPEAAAVQPSAGAVNEQLEWKFVNGQAVGSESQSGQSAASGNQTGSEQAAAPEEQGSSDQAAAPAESGGSGQAAASEEESSDQTANVEEQSSDDQSARSEDQDGSDQSANSDNPPADLKDKVVVIIPKGWKGSLPDLIAALEQSPDAKDIVIVQQGEPQASNEPGDEYQASRRPVINQQ